MVTLKKRNGISIKHKQNTPSRKSSRKIPQCQPVCTQLIDDHVTLCHDHVTHHVILLYCCPEKKSSGQHAHCGKVFQGRKLEILNAYLTMFMCVSLFH